MLRFVLSPDKVVFFDASEKLPGRGMWLKSDYATVQTAVQKKVFYKAAGGTVKIPEDLIDQVEKGLHDRVLSLMGLARKAGALVFGYEAVKKALMNGDAVMAFEADDASERGKDKLYHHSNDLPVYTYFTREELGHLIGQEAGVHVGILKSKVATQLQQNVQKLALFLQGKKKG